MMLMSKYTFTLNVLCILVPEPLPSYSFRCLFWPDMWSCDGFGRGLYGVVSCCLVSELTSLNSFACILSLVYNFLRKNPQAVSSSLIFLSAAKHQTHGVYHVFPFDRVMDVHSLDCIMGFLCFWM